MIAKWKLTPLQEVAKVVSGGTPSSKHEEYFGGEIPWITPKDLSAYQRKHISKGDRNITHLGFKKSSAKLLPKGSVLFTSRAPIGYVAIADNPLTTNQGFKSLILKPGHNPDFFYYLLKYNSHVFERRSSGSIFKEVSGKIVKETKLGIPDQKTQNVIASMLNPLDELIAINNQINQTLEQIAQAIFKSWFVDFEPTKAKIAALQAGKNTTQAEQAAMIAISGKNEDTLDAMKDKRQERYKQLAYTAKLFPSAMQDYYSSHIPKGWSVKPLSSIANLDTTSVMPSHTPDKIWEHYSIPAFDAFKAPVKELGSTIKSSKYRVNQDAVLISKLNPRFQRIWWPTVSNLNAAICSTEFMQFVPQKSDHRGFTYGVMTSKPFQETIRKSVTGSTGSRQRAQPLQVAGCEIIVPCERLIKLYSTIAQSYQETVAENIMQNTSIAMIRDALLHKLLSNDEAERREEITCFADVLAKQFAK